MIHPLRLPLLALPLTAALLPPAVRPARARNIDLSTVPDRQTVQLTIYNSEDLTLVRETRKVSFKPGTNGLQFSWANTLIDPTSVELRFLTQTEKLEVLDTTFPHDKPQMLYWNVQSELDGEATVEITYFTSGISWASDYVLITDEQETQVGLENFVRVTNNSGEEYEDAQVRLVVGKVNLVEKIAQLASLGIHDVKSLSRSEFKRHRRDAAARIIKEAEGYEGGWGDDDFDGDGPDTGRPKEIIKEGLSEYFIYTIEGTETIPNGWSKRLRSLDVAEVPLGIEYRYRPDEYGDQLVQMYLARNDEESKLGTTPLPDGIVRVFRRNGRDGLSFLGSQSIPYVPIGEKIELNLGPDPEVIFELVRLDFWRDNIWMKEHGKTTYRRVDDGEVQIDVRSTVAGWDDHTLYAQRVRNYTGEPIKLEVRRTFGGHVDFFTSLDAKNHDYQTVQFTATVPAGETEDLEYELVQHLGRNQKQSRVEVLPPAAR